MRYSYYFDALNAASSNDAEGRHFDQTLGMLVPNGYDAEKNCRWAELHKVTNAEVASAARAIVTGTSIRKSGSPVFEKVGSGGDMDYKHGKGNRPLGDIGNYNFGYVAFCAGLSLRQAKAAGGIYQIKSGTSKLG